MMFGENFEKKERKKLQIYLDHKANIQVYSNTNIYSRPKTLDFFYI